jgi:hypothetical protein
MSVLSVLAQCCRRRSWHSSQPPAQKRSWHSSQPATCTQPPAQKLLYRTNKSTSSRHTGCIAPTRARAAATPAVSHQQEHEQPPHRLYRTNKSTSSRAVTAETRQHKSVEQPPQRLYHTNTRSHSNDCIAPTQEHPRVQAHTPGRPRERHRDNSDIGIVDIATSTRGPSVDCSSVALS